MSGKGDTRRPAAVPEDVLADNWARTFAIPETRTEHECDGDCFVCDETN